LGLELGERTDVVVVDSQQTWKRIEVAHVEGAEQAVGRPGIVAVAVPRGRDGAVILTESGSERAPQWATARSGGRAP
jgi:hypothetical protein